MSAQLQFQNLTLGYDRHPAVHHLHGPIRSGALMAVIKKAGFVERSTSKPLSCCISDPNLVGGAVSDFDHKVDHIMTNDPHHVGLVDSAVTGLQPINGYWDSDHAGLFSTLLFH